MKITESYLRNMIRTELKQIIENNNPYQAPELKKEYTQETQQITQFLNKLISLLPNYSNDDQWKQKIQIEYYIDLISKNEFGASEIPKARQALSRLQIKI